MEVILGWALIIAGFLVTVELYEQYGENLAVPIGLGLCVLLLVGFLNSPEWGPGWSISLVALFLLWVCLRTTRRQMESKAQEEKWGKDRGTRDNVKAEYDGEFGADNTEAAAEDTRVAEIDTDWMLSIKDDYVRKKGSPFKSKQREHDLGKELSKRELWIPSSSTRYSDLQELSRLEEGAASAFKEQNWTAAIQSYRKATDYLLSHGYSKTSTIVSESYYNRAMAYWKNGNYEKARGILLELQKTNPGYNTETVKDWLKRLLP